MKRPTAQMLLTAYSRGIFPMAHPEAGDEIYWYAPDPRAILPLESFHCARRLRQELRKGGFEMRINSAFEQVMASCAAPRDGQPSTWISSGIIDAYSELHRLGFAHSVEAWLEGELVGGLYGVALGGMFAGESMFHRVTNASKASLVHLVEHLRERGFSLLDIQFVTPHLKQFGAIEISRAEYERRLTHAMTQRCQFG